MQQEYSSVPKPAWARDCSGDSCAPVTEAAKVFDEGLVCVEGQRGCLVAGARPPHVVRGHEVHLNTTLH